MSKLLLALITVLLITVPANAAVKSQAGVKLDAPNLIRLTDNITAGVEVTKGIIDNNLSNIWVEDDKQYAGYIKITYTGTIFSFKK